MIFKGKVERWREPYQPNPAMLRLLLVRQGYEPFQWSNRLGMFYNWHFHEEEQVHWIIKGELEITVQDFGQTFTYTLKAGDRDFMPPKRYHTARVVGETDVLYLVGIKRKPQEEIETVEEEIVNAKTEVVEATPKVKKPRAKSKTTQTKTTPKTRKKK